MKFPAIFLSLVFFIACNSVQKKGQEQGTSKQASQITEFEFTKEMHNFAQLEAGEIAIFSFVFTNTGKNNLFIHSAETGCGCMETTYSEKPVEPGQKGTIEVEFNSSGLYGKQMKTITVKANAPKPKQLAIFAEVKNEQLRIKY